MAFQRSNTLENASGLFLIIVRTRFGAVTKKSVTKMTLCNHKIFVIKYKQKIDTKDIDPMFIYEYLILIDDLGYLKFCVTINRKQKGVTFWYVKALG